MPIPAPFHVPRQVRYAAVAAAAFWLSYFVLWSLRSALQVHDQVGLLAPRLATAAVNAAITAPIFITLTWFAARRLWLAILLATILAIPAGSAYALINSAFFDVPTPSRTAERGTALRQHHHHRAEGGEGRGGRAEDGATLHDFLEKASNGYLLYLGAGLLEISLFYGRSIRALERRSAELQAAARLAEIRALRYQVNPHFLFNTLNSLSTMVLQKRTTDAEAMIDNLALFYRNALTQDPTGDVALEEELRLQRLYLQIEAVRFPDRIEIDFDVTPTLLPAQIPGLILQPLIENAIKHGVSKTTDLVTVTVLARQQGNRLLIRVTDNAARTSYEPPRPGEELSGVGLSNVVNRLAARYDGAATCHWFDLGPRGFCVDLALPLSLPSA